MPAVVIGSVIAGAAAATTILPAFAFSISTFALTAGASLAISLVNQALPGRAVAGGWRR